MPDEPHPAHARELPEPRSGLIARLRRHLTGRLPPEEILYDHWRTLLVITGLTFIENKIEEWLGIRPADWLTVTIVCLLAGFAALFLFSLVAGTLRSGLPRRTLEIISALIVLASCGMGLLWTYDRVIGKAISHPATINAPFMVTSRGDTLYIFGHINENTVESFEKEVQAFGDGIRFVEIRSGGGYVNAAREIAARIEARGYSTRVVTKCSSACLIIFAAGKERYAGEFSLFGCHRSLSQNALSVSSGASGFDRLLASEPVRAQRDRIAALRDPGDESAPSFDPASCDATPHEEMLYISHRDLAELGFITHVESSGWRSMDYVSVLLSEEELAERRARLEPGKFPSPVRSGALRLVETAGIDHLVHMIAYECALEVPLQTDCFSEIGRQSQTYLAILQDYPADDFDDRNPLIAPLCPPYDVESEWDKASSEYYDWAAAECPEEAERLRSEGDPADLLPIAEIRARNADDWASHCGLRPDSEAISSRPMIQRFEPSCIVRRP